MEIEFLSDIADLHVKPVPVAQAGNSVPAGLSAPAPTAQVGDRNPAQPALEVATERPLTRVADNAVTLSAKQYRDLKNLADQAIPQSKRANRYKSQLLRWKIACALSLTAAAGLLIGMVCVATARGQDMARRVAPGLELVSQDTSPDEVLASVFLGGCSGTVISKGETYAQVLTCNHCVTGRQIGSRVPVVHADRKEVTGTLVAVDRDKDLALLTIPAAGVMAVCQVPLELPNNPSYTVVGYPQGRGPMFYTLSDVPESQAVQGDTGMWRWVFSVDGGTIEGGNSGCGVFCCSKLCGVVSHRNNMTGGRTMRCCPHEHVVEFCRRNCRDNGCGEWGCPAPQPKGSKPAPPPRQLQPPAPGNVPIVPPAPGDQPAPAPAPNVQQPAPGTAPAPKGDGSIEPYDGQGRVPSDLNTIKKRVEAIDKLRKQQQQQIDDILQKLQNQPPPSGPQLPEAPAPGTGSVPPPADGPTPAPPAPAPGPPSADLTALKQQMAQLQAELDALQAQLKTVPTQSAVQQLVTQGVNQAVAALPKPQDGKPGPAGTVTVQLVDTNGKVLQTKPNVASGSTVPINKRHFQVAPSGSSSTGSSTAESSAAVKSN